MIDASAWRELERFDDVFDSLEKMSDDPEVEFDFLQEVNQHMTDAKDILLGKVQQLKTTNVNAVEVNFLVYFLIIKTNTGIKWVSLTV